MSQRRGGRSLEEPLTPLSAASMWLGPKDPVMMPDET